MFDLLMIQECRTLGSQVALAEAVNNINNKFIVVGVVEMLDESLEVLECKLPDYFQVQVAVSKLYVEVILVFNNIEADDFYRVRKMRLVFSDESLLNVSI